MIEAVESETLSPARRPDARTGGLPGLAGRRDPRIDLLRALAILLVLVWHFQPFAGFRSLLVSAPVFVFNVEVSLLAVPLLYTVSLLLYFRRGDGSLRALGRRVFRLAWLFGVYSALQWCLAYLVGGSLPTPTPRLLLMGGPPLPVVGDSVFYFLSVLILLSIVAWGFLRLPDRFKAPTAWSLIAVSAAAFLALSLARIEVPYWNPANFVVYVAVAWVASVRTTRLARHAWLLLGGYVAAAVLDVLFVEYPISPFATPVGGMQREVYARVTLLLGVLAALGLTGRWTVRADPVVTATSNHSLGLYALHKWVLLGVIAVAAPGGPGSATGLRWLLVTCLAAAGTVAAVAAVDLTPAWRSVRSVGGRWRPWRASLRAAACGTDRELAAGWPWPAILVASCAAGVVLLTVYRLFFGVNLYDEAFYAALAHRWSQGARPFVDELNFTQTFSYLTYPFVRAYAAAAGGTGGIILALRLLYLAGALAVASLSFAVLRRLIGPLPAALASLACVALVFFSIAAPSYNTIAAAALTIAMLLGLQGLLGPGSRWLWIGLAGLAHGLAVVALPPAAAALPVAATALALLSGRRRRAVLAAYAGGLAVSLGPFALFLVSSGLDHVAEVVRYTSSADVAAGGLVQRLVQRASQAFRLLVWPPLFPGLVAALALGGWLRTRWYPVVLMVSPAVCVALAWRASPYYRALDLIVLYALLAPVIAVGVVRRWGQDPEKSEGRGVVRVLVMWGFLPVLAAGVGTAYASVNGVPNAGVGLAAAVLVTSTLLVLWFRGVPRPDVVSARAVGGTAPGDGVPPRPSRAAGLMAAAALLQVVTLGLVFHYTVVFYDAPLPQLQRRVVDGPYAGLKTTVDRAAELETLTSDLARVSAFRVPTAGVDGGRAPAGVCFILCPGGYLFPGPPANTNSLWQFPHLWPDPARADHLVRYYRRNGVWPLAVFEFRAAPSSDQTAPPCVLGDRYRVLAVRPWYVLYVDERVARGVRWSCTGQWERAEGT